LSQDFAIENGPHRTVTVRSSVHLGTVCSVICAGESTGRGTAHQNRRIGFAPEARSWRHFLTPPTPSPSSSRHRGEVRRSIELQDGCRKSGTSRGPAWSASTRVIAVGLEDRLQREHAGPPRLDGWVTLEATARTRLAVAPWNSHNRRESWPRSAVGGGGYVGPGPCSLGEQAQPMVICALKDRRGRQVGGVFPLLGSTEDRARGDDPARQTPA
jgi:hypothetical protein